jgi:tetratricopeptide (TPR) repeat protein
VIAEQARQEMLAYNPDRARELAAEAVSLATVIGDDEIRADALVTGGVVIATGGDLAGVRMIQEALDLVGNRGKVASRAYTNLSVAYGSLGERSEALAALERGLERSEREGDEQGAWFLRGNIISFLYSGGEWDRCLDLVQMFLDEPQETYMLNAALEARARILDARGDATALDTMRSALEFSERLGDPQTMWPSQVTLAWLARRHDRLAESNAVLEEVFTAMSDNESVGDPQEWHIELVTELAAVGRDADARAIAARLGGGPWADAGLAVVEGRLADAAEVMAAIGDMPLQARLRFLAARRLALEGRLAEAEAQLAQARAFWSSVGATAYLREADDVIAAAS